MVKRRFLLKKAIAVATMLVVTVVTAGCGAVSEEPSKESTAQASEEESSAEETQEELTPAEKWGIDEFVYVMIPGEDDEKAVQLRDNMCQDLSEALGGLPVTAYRATDYNAAVEALRTGAAQMAYLGPFAYVTAAERAGAECMCVSATNGESGYQSYIITRSDSGIESLADLEGRTFGFVDPSSTSGNVVPCNELLRELNLSLSFDELHMDGKFFGGVTYVGNHQNSLAAVVQGDVDAAAISSNTYKNQLEKGNFSEEDIKIIYSSAVIPSNPISIQKDLPEDLKQTVKEFLLNYDDIDYWGGNPDKGYIEVKDSDYDIIRELQQRFGLTD